MVILICCNTHTSCSTNSSTNCATDHNSWSGRNTAKSYTDTQTNTCTN
ncbi:TPA: hypothetical protein ACQWGD_000112 [Neisseria subflava]|uniref:Uncharacterized protein n=1 Tax=Neisseria subflava TaxID=28449 RepID=A0A9X9I3N2_NEISU|nr:hypothetical protein [Neisseria subflava]UTG74985.1 hypothetical protein KCG53_05950 [Neisseria subflava]